MSTSIDIVSNALLLVGDSPISSFDDPGAGAQIASAIYGDTYTSLLSEHPWGFAFKELRLSKLSQVPDIETNYSYAFQLPPDMIRLWAILPYSNYTIVGSLLYSNQTEIMARYIYQPEEVDLPPHFVKALEYKLASDFAISVTEDTQKSQFYEQKYLRQISLARSIDSQGRPQTAIMDQPFVDVRLNGSFSRWM